MNTHTDACRLLPNRHTWFDRDLTLAGRLIVKREDGRYTHDLVRIDRPICRIPTLAIHLTKADERTSFAPNLQSNFYPVLASEVKEQLLRPAAATAAASTSPTHAAASATAASGNNTTTATAAAAAKPAELPHHSLLLELLAQEAHCSPQDIQDLELQLCDTQASAVGGALHEFVFSGRLDNLCSSWQGLRALIDSCDGVKGLAEESCCRVLALFDHEVVFAAFFGSSDPVVIVGLSVLPRNASNSVSLQFYSTASVCLKMLRKRLRRLL
jgi:aspartyl aminopeptidase